MANTTDIGQDESPYRGQTLGPKDVRLLRIDSTKGTLHLRAERHELANIVEYDAISYVWGTAEASVRVLCNDGSLQITPRVYEMLEHLTYTDLFQHAFYGSTLSAYILIDTERNTAGT